MNEAFLSLGGNRGQRAENLDRALRLIAQRCGPISRLSGVYETAAWGYESGNAYLNQVIRISTPLSARQLLNALMRAEQEIGRQRHTAGYSDRVIDLDILFYNNDVIKRKDLQVPHPRLHLRNFVLVPLNEIAPSLVHPVLKQRISRLLKTGTDALGVKPYLPPKDNLYICIEGNIGSGKTTLAAYLAKALGATLLPEKFEQNHLLPLFYQDARTYAFPLEYSFLISRFGQLRDAQEKSGMVVSDFSIYKCLWFARANLAGKELALFEKHFHAFGEHLRQPDLVIHLGTTLSNLEQNIKKRGRPYEQGIGTGYLRALDREYAKGLKHLKRVKTLQLNIDKYHPGLEKKSTGTILQFIEENFGGQV